MWVLPKHWKTSRFHEAYEVPGLWSPKGLQPHFPVCKAIYTPQKLSWQSNIYHLKMYFLLNIVIFHCHVSFQGVSGRGPSCMKPRYSFVAWCGAIATVISSSQQASVMTNSPICELRKNFGEGKQQFPLLSSKFNMASWKITEVFMRYIFIHVCFSIVMLVFGGVPKGSMYCTKAISYLHCLQNNLKV